MNIIYFLYFKEIPNHGYIGKTTELRIKRRMYEHIYNSRDSGKNNKLYNWIRKYIKRYKLECDVILKTKNWQYDEKRLIKEYKERGIFLKNSTIGGEGITIGYKHSAETISKRSQSLSDSKKWLGHKNPFFGKSGSMNHKSKPVYKYSLDGCFLKKYESQRLAAIDLGSPSKARLISRAVKTGEIAYNFLWRSDRTKVNATKRKYKKMSKDDILYCLDQVKKGKSINYLHKLLGFSRNQITAKIK